MINQHKNYWLEKIVPFLILGVSVAIAAALFIFMFYLFIWGVVIGAILWGIFIIKEKFFPSVIHEGRVIDMEKNHDI